MILDMIVANH